MYIVYCGVMQGVRIECLVAVPKGLFTNLLSKCHKTETNILRYNIAFRLNITPP